MAQLKGKSALVTGASRGLGEGVARALAQAGAAVMLAARDVAAVERVAAEITAAGGRAFALACDVADFAQVERLVAQARLRCGGLDILVNNAGVIEPIAEIAASDPEAWARNIAVNLVGPYNAVRVAMPGMVAAGGGTIVNVSSGAAYRPLEGWSAYCSGKAGLAMFTRAIALEAGAKGIRAFGFSPGTIDTEMQVKIRASKMNVISQIPREQLSPVAEAVQGLVYLCTAAADDMAGQDASMRDEAFRKRLGL
ncbi:SDR family NAD(P)-dependent oxidoreductase [Paracraurococcus ruber]|uniref:Short-chain dehydrogenase n=1 Tax=Paracraurococcus ruber TaxID=77675 RepID=A0ABS1CRQ0_9PROT|nr:SDR family oxidoreductase [Paracraurococcus ruber]MBK1657131.1 short-chain dehydrogenase [Paracraurococcus ruber]TDG31699.1 SDR family oxidoreductase [Paracraurococcus ruber]